MNTCIMITHEPVDMFEFEPVADHFKRFGIEAGPYLWDSTRLLWRRPLTVASVCKAIKSAPLECVLIADQTKWCDVVFAEKLKAALSRRGDANRENL